MKIKYFEYYFLFLAPFRCTNCALGCCKGQSPDKHNEKNAALVNLQPWGAGFPMSFPDRSRTGMEWWMNGAWNTGVWQQSFPMSLPDRSLFFSIPFFDSRQQSKRKPLYIALRSGGLKQEICVYCLHTKAQPLFKPMIFVASPDAFDPSGPMMLAAGM